MLTVASELRSVVVHAVGAVCVRDCVVELPAGVSGPTRVRVTGFPSTAYGDWLRASTAPVGTGQSPTAVRVIDVRPVVDVELVAEAALPEVLRDVEAARSRVRLLEQRQARLAEELAGFDHIAAVAPAVRRGDPPRTVPVAAMLELAAFADERMAALNARLRAGDDELRRARRDLAVCTARLNAGSRSERTERAVKSGSAVVTLDATGEATRVELAVEYHVPGARWAPMYQLRLDGAMTGGTLVMRACVAQATGEDWTGVRLGLSTADLTRRTDLPELTSLRLGRRQTAPAHAGWREPPTGLGELFAAYDVVRAEPPRSAPAFEPAPVEPSQVYAAPAQALSVPPPAPMVAGGGFGAAPPPAPAPRSGAVRTRRAAAPAIAPGGPAPRMSAVAMEMEESADAGAPPEPEDLGAPGDELLDYAALELRGADDAHARGRLRSTQASPGTRALEQRRHADRVTLLELPTHAAPPRTSAGSYDYRFDTAASAEVASDGAWHTIPVCEIEVGLEPEFVCVPALDEAVFGTVVLTNASLHALLAGPADVSVGGEFLITVPLPTLAPGGRERVGVGVVESVQVARHAYMRESTAGLRGGTVVLDHRIEIEAVNHLPHAIRLDILERVPVSDDKDVRIEEHTGTPRRHQDTEIRDGRIVAGARVWHIDLAPGARAELTGGYEIRIPAAKAVVGGNRRV